MPVKGHVMEIFAIPIEDKFIIYRPLARLAFVGNQAMANLALRLADQQSPADISAPEEVKTFWDSIGFLKPDSPPPPAPNPVYHPSTAVLLLTSRCNLRCAYCYANGGEEPAQDLSLELAQIAIDYACQSAIEQGQTHFELTFHGGGEPIQAWSILQKATHYARSKQLPCRVSLVSNGIWSARQRDWILNNLDSLSISFDGRPVTQNRQRPFTNGRGSAQTVMRTIAALDKAKFRYGVRMTATAPWRKQLPEDVAFICRETGCQAIQVEPAFNARRGEHQGPGRADSDAFIEAFMEAFEIAKLAGRQLIYSGARPWLLTRTFCTAPYGALIVNPTGRLVTCYEVASDSHTLSQMSTVGRISDDQVVIDHPARNKFLTYLAEKQTTCRDCFCYWHCAGDCYPRAISAGGPSETNRRCFINQQITARLLLWYIMAGNGVWRGQGLHPQETQLLRAF